MPTGHVVAPPGGAVTFLFTDVEGSTKLWEGHPAEMRVALEAHDAILRGRIERHGGFVFSTAGDAFAAAFESPADAIMAASGAQKDLFDRAWPDHASIRVRMGVHTGEAQQRDNDYFGPTLNRAARLMSAAHGGQTVLSAATRSLIDDVTVRDLGAHRLKDLSETEQVWQLLVDGLSTEFPALRTLNAMPTNLPVSLASFIGREDDIDALMTALEKNRLVTMTGVGGVGKSRLSLQVAADASHHYPQGVWFVELAPVRIGDAVPYQFLETLRLDAEPGRTPIETVAHAVGDGAVLLVVDNCEHVLDQASSAIGELLGACPNLRILASSRRALGLAGEQVRPIHPLGVTGSGSAATELFLDRASAARGDVDLTDRLDVIAEICARLDGVPLAIELAAARTRSMSPEDLAGRLDERFRILKGSRSGDGDERHTTLLATIEWSHDLLDDDQKLLFERLAVFAGSFTLTAAEQICADEELDEFDVVDLIDGLVEHSLLIADTSGGTTRFRMLETIREFAGQQLGDQLMDLRDRHGEWHAQWIERIWARLFTTEEPDAVRELEAGWTDLRAAAVHATGDLPLLSRLLRWLGFEMYARCRFEVRDWALAGLAVADLEGATDTDRAVLLAISSTSGSQAGDTANAITLGSEFADLCAHARPDLGADVYCMLSGALLLTGDLDLTARVQELADAAAAGTTEPWAAPWSAGTGALLAVFSGQVDRGRQLAGTARDTVPDDICPTLRAALGWVIAMNHDGPRSEVVEQMERVLELGSIVHSPYFMPAYTQYLSSIRAEVGEVGQAMTEAAENLGQLRDSNTLGMVPPALRRAAVLLLKAEHPEPAAQLLGWVDSHDSVAATPDLAAEIDVLVPEMLATLGPDSAKAIATGAALSLDDAIQLAIVTLRAAAEDSTR